MQTLNNILAQGWRINLVDRCVCVKVKLYLTSTDDQSPSQNNSSAGYPVTLSGSANMLTPGSANVGVNAATSQLSDFDDDTSDPEEDLSETDDDDELWTIVSAVLQQTRV